VSPIHTSNAGSPVTGKSHLFQQISPYAHLLSGGKATVAKMFVNNATGQRGLVCQYDVVCFDEVGGISFGQVWGVSPGASEAGPGLYRIDVTCGPGSGVKVLNQPTPPAFRESVRIGKQNLYTRAKELVGDRNPREEEFSIQMRAMDADKTGGGHRSIPSVSRPHVVALLERNELTYRKVGSHRRILLKDLIEFQQRSRIVRKKALDDLAGQTQVLGMGYSRPAGWLPGKHDPRSYCASVLRPSTLATKSFAGDFGAASNSRMRPSISSTALQFFAASMVLEYADNTSRPVIS